MTQPEALRLADLLEMGSIWQDQEKAAAELRRLHADNEALRADLAENEALRERLADILRRTAVALRGPEPPLTRWSWHDLPERAAAAIAAIVMQRAAAAGALEALKEIVAAADGKGWEQLDPSFKKARAAIKQAEGEKR